MNRALVFGGLGIGVLVAGGAFFLLTQRADDSGVGQRAAPPPAAAASTPAPSGAVRFAVAEKGVATFLIDAPLEKIKGRWTKLRGQLDVDVNDLRATRGEVDLDMGDLKTETFTDTDKNAAQTEHAHNWLGLGDDVPAAERDDNRWARFTIKGVDEATPAKLTDAPESAGSRVVKVVAHGDMWLHGVTSPKTVKLTATFSGAATAPTAVRFTTDAPLLISMKEHDIKPRDVAGKFLNGALERVGKKIDDSVQITLDANATPSPVASAR